MEVGELSGDSESTGPGDTEVPTSQSADAGLVVRNVVETPERPRPGNRAALPYSNGYFGSILTGHPARAGWSWGPGENTPPVGTKANAL